MDDQVVAVPEGQVVGLRYLDSLQQLIEEQTVTGPLVVDLTRPGVEYVEVRVYAPAGSTTAWWGTF